MDPSQSQGSLLTSDDANDLLRKATQRIVRLEELLAQRESELKDQRSLSTGLRAEFDDASQVFKATYGRNMALLSLLSHVRKLLRDSSRALADMRIMNRAMTDTIRFMSTVQASNETLHQEVDAQKRRADDYSALLNKIVKESQKTDLPLSDSSSTDPNNLILQSWHAEEVALRQEIIELSVETTLQVRVQAQAREEVVHRRLSEAVAKEYDIGYAKGYARGRGEAVRRVVAPDNVERQIDEFLKEAISALDGSNAGIREKMLEEFQAALAAPHCRSHFI